MAVARYVTVRNFRGIDDLWGEMRVVGRARSRGGALSLGKPGVVRRRANGAATDDENRGHGGGVAALGYAAAPNGETCAEAAREKSEEKEGAPRRRREKKPGGGDGSGDGGGPTEKPSLWDERVQLGAGPELPRDGWEFLKAVNAKIDVVSMMVLLLRSHDDKLAGRLAEQLLEMGYENAGRVEEGDEDYFDVPRPVRD